MDDYFGLITLMDGRVNSFAMTSRVLMVGPGVELTGGIASLVGTMLPVLRQEVELRYLPTVSKRPARQSGRLSLGNLRLAAGQYARFLRELYRFRPNIVHVHTSPGLAWLKDTFYVLAARLHGCRIVVHPNAEFEEFFGRRGRLFRSYTGTILSLVNSMVVVSCDWERRLKSIMPDDRVLVLRNCIDTAAFSAAGPEAKVLGQALFLGTIGRNKGAFDLIEAVGVLKSRGRMFKAWVAGPEERDVDAARARDRVEQLSLGDMCQLVGTVRGLEKIDLLGRACILVLPSYKEGLPLAVLEAMAAGLAIVATPVGGIPDIITHGYNGLLVPVGDVERLAEGLGQLAGDPELCCLMGQRNRSIAEQEFDVKPYVKRLVALYESLSGN